MDLDAALIRETTRLKFLVAFRPGSITPTLAAQMAGTFQRHSNGRALLNVVTGGDAGEQRRFGDWLSHDERYERTDEFLAMVRGAWSGEPYDLDGKRLRGRGCDDSRATRSAPRHLLRRRVRSGGAGRAPRRRVPHLG